MNKSDLSSGNYDEEWDKLTSEQDFNDYAQVTDEISL
jgi:hypothetical protein